MEDRINPVCITWHKDGKKYTLDFCRESVVFAERRGFKLEDAVNFPVTGSNDLFYYSFRMHHKNVSREKIDKILESWGNSLPENVFLRLIKLYEQVMISNSIHDDEDDNEESTEKKPMVTVEM